jgi:DNA transformation protein
MVVFISSPPIQVSLHRMRCVRSRQLDGHFGAAQRGDFGVTAAMPNTSDFIAHVLDTMQTVGSARARAMFGGHGVYLDDVIVGIVADDVLYLKADDATRGAFVERDLEPFCYRGHDGALHQTSYFRAPDDALESPPAMREWLRRALAAALRKRAAKAPRKRSPRVSAKASGQRAR